MNEKYVIWKQTVTDILKKKSILLEHYDKNKSTAEAVCANLDIS